MSHYIEDDKKVIKTARGYIFMCLGGDNNVTESVWVGGNKKWAEVRARSWCHLNHQILEATDVEIMAFCQRVYGGDPEHEVFKKNGKWVCNKDMPNYFRDGIRRAQSLEALIQANRGQCLDASVRVYPDKDSISYKTQRSCCIRTTKDLEEWLDEAKPLRQMHLDAGRDCYICLSFYGNKPLVYGTEDSKEQVVLKSTRRGDNSYICDFIHGRQISFTQDLDKALVFENAEDAWAAIGTCWQNIKAVSFTSQTREVNKPFVLLFGSGNSGLCGFFLRKQSRTKVYGSATAEKAMHFANQNAAVRYATELREKGWDASRCKEFILVNTKDNTRLPLAV